MHTFFSSVGVDPTVRCVLLWLVLLLAAGGAPPASAQSGFPGSGRDVQLNARVYPLDIWAPRAGPGAAAGLVVHNLGLQDSQWLLTVAPATNEQTATLSFASGDPRRARRYVMVDAWARHTDRLWFHGLGPASREDSRLSFNQDAVRVRVRTGQTLLGRRLRLHPEATLQFHRVSSVDGPIGALQPRSEDLVRRLQGGAAPGNEQVGLRVGAALAFDTRNNRRRPTRGVLVQGRGHHYVNLDDSGLGFDQFDVNAYGYVPLGGRHRLALRGRLTITDRRGDVPIPFYQLPTLDGSLVPGWDRSRFVGADRLLFSTLYRFPLADLSGLFRVEGHVGVHAASVYNDIGEQFEASLSFEDPLSETDDTYPLRPAASVGVQFGLPLRERTLVELALGVSPEGVSGVRFSFSHALDLVRSPHHPSRSLR